MSQVQPTFWNLIQRQVRTLRFRLAAWNAVVVVATAMVLLVGLRQGVRWTLQHEMDQILIEDTEEILLALQEFRTVAIPQVVVVLERKAAGHQQHRWFAELIDREGRSVWRSSDAPTDSPGFALNWDDDTPQMVTLHGFRFVQRKTPQSSRFGAIRVGSSVEFIDVDMARLDRLMLGGIAGSFLAAPLVGYWMARRAAQVLGNITQTAARLRPSHLEERLPVRGTGDELDQLSLTVNGLLDRIGNYLEEKRDFLANAAHELRTPLAAIRSSAEVSLAEDRTPAEYQRLLEDIIEEGTTLEGLVNQLLLLSETEALRLNTLTRQVALHTVVAKAVDMFAGVAEARHLTLTVRRIEPAMVLGNETHLRQVVNNLVDNAIKYTPAGGQVTIEQCRKANDVQLTISDSGIGISAEDLPHVFDRFFRADRARTRDGMHGTGLGLSICLAVVTAHRGTIECRSDLDRGTAFTVRFPAGDG